MDAWTVASGILLAGLVVVAAWTVVIGLVASIASWSNRGSGFEPNPTFEAERRAARMARKDMARELRRGH
jgi:hypothetical protein